MPRIIDLLQHPTFAKARFVAGPIQHFTFQVQGFAVIAERERLQQYSNELVISTTLLSDEGQITRLIQRVAQAGAVALGMYLAPNMLSAARVAADEVQLLIIAFPADFLPRELEEYLSDAFHHTKSLESLIARWIPSSSSDSDLTTMMQIMSNEWKRSLVLLDNNWNFLSFAGSDGPFLINSLLHWQKQYPQSQPPTLIPEMRIFGTRLRSGKFLMMHYHQDLSPSYDEVQMLEDAALVLEPLIQHSLNQCGEFLRALLRGVINDERVAFMLGQPFGFDIRVSSRIVVGMVNTELWPDGAQQITQYAGEIASTQNISLLSTIGPGQVIMIINSPISSERINALLRDIILAASSAAHQITWGVSGVNAGLDGFQMSYQDALMACQLGKGPGSVNLIDHLGGYTILRKLRNDPESQQFWKRHLLALLKSEYYKSKGLIETLEVYLDLQGNVSETARQLHIHRQTMNYRLQRIAELTGCNLDEPHDRFTLELSLHLYKLHLHEKSGKHDDLVALSAPL